LAELEDFYEAYVGKVYKFFYINCLDKQAAEDLTSSTFIAFMDKIAEKSIQDRKKYLYGIMRNVWAGFLRDKYNHNVISIENIDNFEVYSEESVSSYENSDLSQRALVFINQLPKSQQIVARMRLIDGKTLPEISQQLGKNMAYVKTTQNRAIKSLKRLLRQPYLQGGLR
jgi:RNA polymerase sigma-70 factor (ECF subfamily)